MRLPPTHRAALAVAAIAATALVATVAATQGGPTRPTGPTEPHPQAAPTTTAFRTHPELTIPWHGMWANYTEAQRGFELGLLRQANIRTVRMDVSWAMLQPKGRTYDRWGVAFLDRVIATMRAYGITPLITLWLTPAWANGRKGERVLPTDPADYARVATWAAHRYAGKVAAWEVWHEPNTDRFLAGADPAAYTRLLRAAYPALKAGDPAATVAFGSVRDNDDAWIARAYDAGAKGYFDVMSTHVYRALPGQSPLAPDDGTVARFSHLVAVHDLMVARGDGALPVWTGLGYSTPPDLPAADGLIADATQAAYLNAAVNLIHGEWPWVERFSWYITRDENVEATYDDRHFGLVHTDLTPKPLLTMLRTLTDPTLN